MEMKENQASRQVLSSVAGAINQPEWEENGSPFVIISSERGKNGGSYHQTQRRRLKTIGSDAGGLDKSPACTPA